MRVTRLSNLYNSLSTGNPKRLHVYQAIVAVAARSGRTSLLVPQVAHLDAWLAEWHASPSEARALLLELADAFRKAQLVYVARPSARFFFLGEKGGQRRLRRSREWRKGMGPSLTGPSFLSLHGSPRIGDMDSPEAHDMLRKYLTALDKDGLSASSESRAAAIRAVVEAINAPGVFQFDELLAQGGTAHGREGACARPPACARRPANTIGGGRAAVGALCTRSQRCVR